MLSGFLSSLKVFAAGKRCVSTLLFGEVCDYCDGGAALKIAAEIIKIFSVGIGILGVIGITIVGLKYLNAGGDEAKAVKARKRLIQIIAGLAGYVVLLSVANFLVPGGIVTATLDESTSSCPDYYSTEITVHRPTEEELPYGGGSGGGGDPGSSTPLVDGKSKLYTFNGEQYVIADTKNPLDTYIGILQKYRVAQDQYGCKIVNNSPSCTDYGSYKASRDSDTCLSFAYTFVHDLYFGTYTSDWCASQYKRGSWDDIQSDSLQEILTKAYNEINNGRPVVILVHYVSSTSRHFVTMIGYRASVKNATQLTKDDLLLLNTNYNTSSSVQIKGLTRAGGGKLEVIKDTHDPHKYRIFVLKPSVYGAMRSNIITCN